MGETTQRAFRRFTDHKAAGKPLVLPPDHKAVVGVTTLFPSRVATPHEHMATFKSGVNSRKIGSHVTKGMWKGLPIYTLTLEERATCPTVCEHWHDCFGNKMHWSTRWKAGKPLEKIIPMHVDLLLKKHPKGIVIRLHVLGDFYSVPYATMWWSLMMRHAKLRVFGYTRREQDSIIGSYIHALNTEFPTRWRVRWSERGGDMGTVSVNDVTLKGKTPQGIVCPAQTEQSACCGTCGLCWNSEVPIVFITH